MFGILNSSQSCLKLLDLIYTMIVLGTPWFQEAESGRLNIIGILGSAGVDAPMLGQKAIIQHNGETKERFEVLVTSIVHYDTLAEFITGEGYQNIAPQSSSCIGCESALLSIYLGRLRVYNSNQIRACGGINAWRVELI